VDPLGLKPTDDDPFSGPDPELVGAMLDGLQSIHDAGCTPVLLDRMRDYMFGTLRPPCGFQTWAYDVEFLTDIKAGSRVAVDPYGDCKAADLIPAGIGLTYGGSPMDPLFMIKVGFGTAVGARAVDAFHETCRSHDYGYDLLRYAKYELGIGSINSARRAADETMNEMMGNICSSTGNWGVFNSWTCRDARQKFFATLFGVTLLMRDNISDEVIRS
jgi:hypothetical protein